MGERHINAFLTVAKHERKCVGTFPFSADGEMDAHHALADARKAARDSGYDLTGSASEVVFVDTSLLASDGKSVREFASAGDLNAAMPRTKEVTP